MNTNPAITIEMKIAIQIITSFIIPVFTSIFVFLFSNPKKDEEELSKKRQQLLMSNRNLVTLKISEVCDNCLSKIKNLNKRASDEIDELIPKSGSELNGEILLGASILQYIFANSNSLKAIFNTETKYLLAKKMIRFYKYIIIFLPFISGGLYILYLLFVEKNIDWSKLILYLISVLAVIIIVWFLKEKIKDKYTDMSDDLEGL